MRSDPAVRSPIEPASSGAGPFVITGAGSGIGLACAQLLREEGIQVEGWDVAGQGVRHLDVSDAASVEAALADCEKTLGPVRGLVHAAGIHLPGGTVQTMDPAARQRDLSELLRVNVLGTAAVLGAFGTRMLEHGDGAIVVIGSDAAVVPRPAMGLYGASKAGCVQLTLAAALELAAAGVRCNVVCPGATDTPMQRRLWPGSEPPAHVVGGDPASFRGPIPLGRIAGPEDIARTVRFLLSPDARHITAQRIMVDGGAALGR